MAVHLTQPMLEELKDAFGNYNEGGQIFLRDIGPVVRCVKGLKPSESEVREMMVEAEKGDGSTKTLFGSMIELQMLVQLISKYVTEPDPDGPDELAMMFKPHDRDGRGTVTLQDFRHAMTTVGEKMTDEEVDDLLKMTGAVEHGDRVNYIKFCRAIVDS